MNWIVEPQKKDADGQSLRGFCGKLCPGWLSVLIQVGQMIYDCFDGDALCEHLTIGGCE